MMKKERVIKRKYLTIIALLVAMHFLLTAIIGHYIAKDIGTKMGHVVAKGLIEASESQNPSDADKIYKDMRHEADTINAHWYTVSYVLSLPTGFLLKPFWRWAFKEWIYFPIVSKKITKEQVRFRGYAIDYLQIGINSFAFGALLYLMVWGFLHIKRR